MSRACRSLRRLEDPALVEGFGRFTADLPADLAVRFVRGAVAAGRILAVMAAKGANTVLARHLPEVKPIRPILHRPDYVAVGHPILADDEVRFVGEPIAAERIRDKLLRIAGRLLEAAPADIVVKSGAAEVAGTDRLVPIETLAEGSPTKAEGLGEGGAIGAPAAIVNAISDALASFGVALCEIPAGPQRIRALLRAAMEKRA